MQQHTVWSITPAFQTSFISSKRWTNRLMLVWKINANKIYLRVTNAEVVLFKSLKKQQIVTYTLKSIGNDCNQQIQWNI